MFLSILDVEPTGTGAFGSRSGNHNLPPGTLHAMGLNSRGLEFLSALGGSWGSTATLGRQELHGIDDDELSGRLGRISSDGWPARAADPVLLALGATSVTSVDASDFEGATVRADLNEPVADDLRHRFDTVLDAGTTEHVFNFPVALANAMDMVRTGGRLIHMVPMNQAAGHGFYQLSPESFLRTLVAENGYRVECALVREETARGEWRKVLDPAVVGRRIETRTVGPAYLYIAARRISHRPIFAAWPQQSDYTARWEDPAGFAGDVRDRRWRTAVSACLPDRVRDTLRGFANRPSDRDAPPIGDHLSHELLARHFPGT